MCDVVALFAGYLCLSLCVGVCVCVRPSVCQSVCQSVWLSVCTLWLTCLPPPRHMLAVFAVDCVAKGGRYDDLVVRFRNPGDRRLPLVAVGVRFALDRLNAVVSTSKVGALCVIG